MQYDHPMWPVWRTLGMKAACFSLLASSFMNVSVTSPSLAQTTKTSPAANSTERKSYFEEDPRLAATISIKSHAITYRELWQTLENKLNAPIEREDSANEFDTSEIALAGSKITLRALMDAMAARSLARWERTEKNGYRFLTNQFEYDFVYGAKSESEQERFAAGAEFIQDLHSLPKQEQARLLAGKQVAVSSLPEEMQQSLSRMFASYAQEEQHKAGNVNLRTDAFLQATFRLERKPASGFNRFYVSVQGEGVGGSWRFNDYEAQKQVKEAARQKKQEAGEPGSLYTPVKWELTYKEANRLPALKRLITIDMQAVTFPEVLRRLHEKYNIPFVSDSAKTMPHRADIAFRAVPLGEALDRLTKIYRDTEWEWRKQGFLIVRSPSNPIRHINSPPYARANTPRVSQ